MKHSELLPVPGSGLSDLSRERLADYLTSILGREVPTTEEAWHERLCAQGFMVEQEDDLPVCTIAGFVLFGYRPRRLLGHAGIRWKCLDGKEQTRHVLDDQVIEGPLVDLWKVLSGGRELVGKGVIEGLADAMRPFISEEAGQIEESMRRERRWHYPLEALREGVVNALTHRDWTRQELIEVVRYGDRIEILSPGGLQTGMTVERIISGQRAPRNPLISNTLRDYGYLDARGIGVRNKIIPLMRAYNGVDPAFEATEDYLRLTLRRSLDLATEVDGKQETMGNARGAGRPAQAEEVPAGYKRTEVGTIPEEWSVSSIGELFGFLRTASNSRADLGDTGAVAYVHYGDIHTRFHHFIDFSRASVPRLLDSKRGTAARLRDGDLIVADASEDEAGVGKSVEVRNLGTAEAVAGLHTFLLRSRDRRVHDGYRGYLLEKEPVQRQLRRRATGLKVFGISKRAIRDVRIPLPSRSEQHAIAAALSDVDGLLAALAALIAKKRAVKQAAMQQLLTGKTRLPGYSGAWEAKQLGELGTFSKGRGIKREDVSDTGLPCIRYGELYTRYKDYILNPTSRIRPCVALEALPIERGNLLFAGSGETAEEIGTCAAYLGEEPAYVGGDVIVLTPLGQDSIYLGHLMNHPTVAAQKSRMGQGDAVVHISAGNLAQVRFELPPLREQTAIAAVLSDIDAEIVALEQRRDKTRALKQGMMQQLLTGRVRLVQADPIVEDLVC